MSSNTPCVNIGHTSASASALSPAMQSLLAQRAVALAAVEATRTALHAQLQTQCEAMLLAIDSAFNDHAAVLSVGGEGGSEAVALRLEPDDRPPFFPLGSLVTLSKDASSSRPSTHKSVPLAGLGGRNHVLQHPPPLSGGELVPIGRSSAFEGYPSDVGPRIAVCAASLWWTTCKPASPSTVLTWLQAEPSVCFLD